MEFTIKVTDQDLAVINEGLQEIKVRIAVPVITRINEQVRAQIAAGQELKKPARRKAKS